MPAPATSSSSRSPRSCIDHRLRSGARCPSGERLTAPTCLHLRRHAARVRGPSGDRRLLAMTALTGVVSEWDERGGYGTITGDEGTEHFFHCTQLVDGTRTT